MWDCICLFTSQVTLSLPSWVTLHFPWVRQITLLWNKIIFTHTLIKTHINLIILKLMTKKVTRVLSIFLDTKQCRRPSSLQISTSNASNMELKSNKPCLQFPWAKKMRMIHRTTSSILWIINIRVMLPTLNPCFLFIGRMLVEHSIRHVYKWI